ncbi:oligosaccharide flippase family protein [Chloroflexota bacterium]
MATVVVPEEYGMYGYLGLWLMYAGLIRPGFTLSGYREIPVLLGKGQENQALRIQNISVTSDMLYSILPFTVILGASFFTPEPILKFGLIMVAFSYGINRVVYYWQSVNFLRQNFNIVAKGKIISAIASPLAIVALVYWLKVYALLIAPIFTAVVVGTYFWRKGSIKFRFTFDRKETVRLAKVGIVLQTGALVFVAFRLADRTIIASTLSIEQLGFYTFAIAFIIMVLTIPTNFTNVLQPILYKELGRTSNAFEGFKDTKRIAVYLALGGAVLIPISQSGFYFVVNLITTNYIPSVPIFYVLSYNIFLASNMAVANLVLISSVVNKQKVSLGILTAGLALNIFFDLLVIRLGYGVIGVAWVTIVTQGLVTVTLYYMAKNYMFGNVKEYFRFQITIWTPFLLTIPFYFFHNSLNLVVPNVWAFTGISLAAQVIIWGLLISIFYRAYVSKNHIRTVLKEINLALGNRLVNSKEDLE